MVFWLSLTLSRHSWPGRVVGVGAGRPILLGRSIPSSCTAYVALYERGDSNTSHANCFRPVIAGGCEPSDTHANASACLRCVGLAANAPGDADHDAAANGSDDARSTITDAMERAAYSRSTGDWTMAKRHLSMASATRRGGLAYQYARLRDGRNSGRWAHLVQRNSRRVCRFGKHQGTRPRCVYGRARAAAQLYPCGLRHGLRARRSVCVDTRLVAGAGALHMHAGIGWSNHRG